MVQYRSNMDKNPSIQPNFVGNIREELKKVSWPTRKEAVRLTIAVFVISLIVGVYMGIIDFSLAKLLSVVTTLKQ